MRTGRAARPMLAARFTSTRRLMPRGVEASRDRKAARSAFKPQAAATMARQAKPHSLISPCRTTGTCPEEAGDEAETVLIASVPSSKDKRRGRGGNERQTRNDPAFKTRAHSPRVARLTRCRGFHCLRTKQTIIVRVLAVAIPGRWGFESCRHLILQCGIDGLAQAAAEAHAQPRSGFCFGSGPDGKSSANRCSADPISLARPSLVRMSAGSRV